MKKITNTEIAMYVKLVLSKTGDLVTGGVVGLILFVLSFYLDFPVFKTISLVVVFVGILSASYKVWKEQYDEATKSKVTRMETTIKRVNVERYNMLELVNTGEDDIVDLKLKIPDRYLMVCNQNTNLVFASEIEPSIIKVGERLLAHFPAEQTKVVVTGKGRTSQQIFRKEKTI